MNQINYNDLRDLDRATCRSKIADEARLTVRDLKVLDLVGENAGLESQRGIYVFVSGEDTIQYVGKASSRSFVERIPAHFAVHDGAWMAILLQRIAKRSASKEVFDHLREASSMRLVLISGKALVPIVGAVETALRIVLEPRLNPYSSKRRFDQHTGQELGYVVAAIAKQRGATRTVD